MHIYQASTNKNPSKLYGLGGYKVYLKTIFCMLYSSKGVIIFGIHFIILLESKGGKKNRNVTLGMQKM